MIKGILIPAITPFDVKERVDESILRELVEFYIESAVQGLFVLGSSGQGPAMSTTERKRAAEIVLDQNRSRIPIVIHVGTADAESTVELADHAATFGATAVGVIPPYYYSDHTEFEIMSHYRAVGKAVSLPIFIYENPKYSGISIPPEFGIRLKEMVPTIQGIKVAYGMGNILEYIRLFPSDVSVFTGNADLFAWVPFGLSGMINPPTSFLPEVCVELWHSLDGRKFKEAVELQKRINTVARLVGGALRRYGRSVLGEVFRMRGFKVVRFPKWETQRMPEESREYLYKELKEGGFLNAPLG